MFKQITSYIKLKGEIIEADGTVSKITVKIGGLIHINNCC